MRQYSLGARTVATVATANTAAAVLWNPGAAPIFVNQLSWAKTVATADHLAVVRCTARGTATTTLAAGISSDYDNYEAPISTAVIDTAWSAQPTLQSTTLYLFRWNMPAAISSGFVLPFPDQLKVPAGGGLAIVTPVATILQPGDVTFNWRE